MTKHIVRHTKLASPPKAEELATTWFEVARAGVYHDWRYDDFAVTVEQLHEFVANYNAKTLDDVVPALDVEHSGHARAFIAELEVRGEGLFARFNDWTEEGIALVTGGAYRYFSIEFGPLTLPGGKVIANVLRGIALTNRPVLRRQQGTFCEKEEITALLSEEDARNNHSRMKDMLKKLGESMIADGRATKREKERFAALLSEADEETKEELKETSDAVENLEDEAPADDSEAQAELAETKKQLAEAKATEAAKLTEAEKKLAATEENVKVLLAEKAKRETEEVAQSLMLSETSKVGFPAAQLDEARAFVAAVGVEAARKFAEAMPKLVTLSADAMKQKTSGAEGKLSEDGIDHEKATARAKELCSGDAKLSEADALARAYSEQEKSGK